VSVEFAELDAVVVVSVASAVSDEVAAALAVAVVSDAAVVASAAAAELDAAAVASAAAVELDAVAVASAAVVVDEVAVASVVHHLLRRRHHPEFVLHHSLHHLHLRLRPGYVLPLGGDLGYAFDHHCRCVYQARHEDQHPSDRIPSPAVWS